jgi:predicted CXXCH cytochrome family protein
MNTSPASPNTTLSVLCLGCHDGTVGNATVYGIPGNDKHRLINKPGFNEGSAAASCSVCHPHGLTSRKLKLGTNLSNMHPIAMTYPTAAQDPMFAQPPDLQQGWTDVKLFNGKVECSSCHKVHDPAIRPFLRKSNDGSGLCLTCHLK